MMSLFWAVLSLRKNKNTVKEQLGASDSQLDRKLGVSMCGQPCCVPLAPPPF